MPKKTERWNGFPMTNPMTLLVWKPYYRSLYRIRPQIVSGSSSFQSWQIVLHGCHRANQTPIRFFNNVLGCQRFVSQPKSVFWLTPNSNANCFLIFRIFSLFCLIFWPMVTRGIRWKKATQRDSSLRLGLTGHAVVGRAAATVWNDHLPGHLPGRCREV